MVQGPDRPPESGQTALQDGDEGKPLWYHCY